MADNNVKTMDEQQELNEILRVRREKLAVMKESGNDPFTITKFDFDNDSENIKSNFEELEGKTVKIAGRIMARRIMGKASFVGLKDTSGKIQLYVRRDDVGEDVYAAFKKWDIGDIVGVEGSVFKTQTGEISVHATSIKLLSKSLLPLPEKFHGLTNNDLRFRQRYVDLIMNDNVKKNFIVRSKFIKFMRKYLDDMNYIEVETPV
ncbi:MAG: lysine--tRNA ligase, partial [Clostridia bacterium]|nr:lysine--tRNA ligase [Clostridia bacterium]